MGKNWTKIETEQAIGLIKEGKTYEEIRVVLNKTWRGVREKLAKLGHNFELYNPNPGDKCGENEKYCGTCKTIKDIELFNKNKNKIDGYNTICRECSKKRSKTYYVDNNIKHKKAVLNRNKKERLINTEKLYQYYLEHPCVDCGETDPIVLESDHKDGTDKRYCVSQMVGSFLWGIILTELEKCETRCANCHRRRTAKQFNWYKYNRNKV